MGTLRHGDSEDDLDCAGGAGDMPPQLTGVAAMISNVVNQVCLLTELEPSYFLLSHSKLGPNWFHTSSYAISAKNMVRRFRSGPTFLDLSEPW